MELWIHVALIVVTLFGSFSWDFPTIVWNVPVALYVKDATYRYHLNRFLGKNYFFLFLIFTSCWFLSFRFPIFLVIILCCHYGSFFMSFCFLLFCLNGTGIKNLRIKNILCGD